MFAARYFAPRYFTERYWSKVGLGVEVPVEPPIVAVGPPAPPREIPFERIDALAKGKLLVVRCSLIPGSAIGAAKAPGDSVLVVNAVAGGVEFEARWQMIGGLARSTIVLTDDEEIMLLLAEAA